MQELIDFFLKVGELKEIPKRGWVLVGVRDPESVMEHSFQVAILAWVLGKEKRVKLDTERILKIALTHDLCELYAGDETPYDKILPKDEKEWPELFDKWPRATKREKARRHKEKHQREAASLRKLLERLPLSVREEILELWLDYEQGKTKEARFVRQVNRIQTLLQALDYGEKQKIRVYKSWWVGSKEKIDDPLLVRVMRDLEGRFCPEETEEEPEKT